MYKSFSKIIIRTPVQSLKKFNGIENINLNSFFKDGVYLSSSDLWVELQKNENVLGADREKIHQSFLKYWIRSTMRCTPFSTFAGSTIVNIIDNSEPNLTNINLTQNHLRYIRIDTNYLWLIIQRISLLPEIKQQIKFYPNNSLYQYADKYRYAEYVIQNNTKQYHLTSIDKSIYLESILNVSASGATILEISNELKNKNQIYYDNAIEYIDQLINCQVLIPDLESNVTGKEPFDQLIEKISRLQHIDKILSNLLHINNLIRNPIAGVQHYQTIENALKQLSTDIEVPKDKLQVDLFLKTSANQIQKDLVNAIVAQTSDLTVFARKNAIKDLENFKAKFSLRFENAKIPLSVALDADLGIGYSVMQDDAAGGSEIIDNLILANSIEQRKLIADEFQKYSLYKYHEYLSKNLPEIRIIEDDLKPYKKSATSFAFPNSLYLMGCLLKHEDKLDVNSFIFDMKVMSGPSAANLLGRFAHGNKEIENFTKEILETEEQNHPDVIYAEVVHLPESRVGNVILRPVLRKFEIPYCGISGAPEVFQIKVDDLYVSIQNDEVILFSKRLNKRIIPSLTTAHNFSQRSLPIYKFLCDLQHQGLYHPFFWDWGMLDSLKHLPRVVYKNIIIKRARWRIEEKDVKDLPKNRSEYVHWFQQFRKHDKIPNHIVYVEADNELLLDLSITDHIEILLSYIKKYKTINIEEFLFTDENCVVRDEEGNPYTNEIIIPLYKEKIETSNKATVILKPQNQTKINVKRKFAPGSEWLYIKVYCGTKSAERIFTEALLPFIEQGKLSGLFEKFFFIRYKDDFQHFRIRFYNQNIASNIELQQKLMHILQPYLESGLIDKVNIDTYTRELERYGSNLIEEAESLFHYDSIAVLRFLSLKDTASQIRYRMLFAIRGIEALLNDFKFQLQDKKELLQSMQSGYFKEFGAKPELQKQLNTKYREFQKDIFSFLIPRNDMKNGFFDPGSLLKRRSKDNAAIIESIFAKLEPENRKQRLFELLPSYIHMFMNRLFIAQQRKYELVIYHFLDKYYASIIAIENQKQTS